MAGDWIKMRTDLYRDPKVCAIADQLMRHDGELAAYVNQNCHRDMTVTRNVMRNVTVGALVSVWGVMRLRGKRVNDDLVLKSATLFVIDDLSELQGFGHAMESVGWVMADENGVTFPNFFSEYNVDPNEDAKAKNAERQRKYREKTKQESNVTRSVTVTSQSNAREEKRREEKYTYTNHAEAVISAYHEALPELPRVKLITDKRKKSIGKFVSFVLTSKKSDGTVRATNVEEALVWIKAYFMRVRDNAFLMGKIARVGEHSGWQCDLDYLITERGITQVIEKTREAA